MNGSALTAGLLPLILPVRFIDRHKRVNDMEYGDTGFTLRHEFDNFLFAIVGEGRNGGLVSVLSALARLDLDPWKEAEKLSQLPPATATRKMVSFIAAQSAGSLICSEPATTAYRLVALLPRAGSIKHKTQQAADIPQRSEQMTTFIACEMSISYQQWS